MSEARTSRGPGLAATDRGRTGPFAALLRRTTSDPHAADGFALAYAELDEVERRQLLHLVTDDARREGIDVTAALARMLGVEQAPALVEALVEALWSAADRALPDLRDTPRADTAGALLFRDGPGGLAVLLRPGEDGGFEQLEIAWTAERCTRIEVSTAPSWTEALDALDRRLEPAPIRTAIDAVAPILWRHRRSGGGLPPGAARFAALFA